MKKILQILFLVILIPTAGYAGGKHDNKGNKNSMGVEVLSHDLRQLLSEEMRALQNGMISIIPAYVSGDWTTIKKIAGKMKNSYILKQRLTKNQKKELHARLPLAFIKADQKFHYLASMLEHAADKEKGELINFYFSEMNESCVTCHSLFATHRFPALSSKKKVEGSEH